MRIAFAGFRHGHIFELYNLAQAHDSVQVAAAWENNDELREEMASTQNIVFTHNTYEEMLADDGIDAVAIGDYYAARGQLAVKALKAGKHIIADKPLCTSLEELDEIEKLSKAKGLEVSCMFSLVSRFENSDRSSGANSLDWISRQFFVMSSAVLLMYFLTIQLEL